MAYRVIEHRYVYIYVFGIFIGWERGEMSSILCVVVIERKKYKGEVGQGA